ncbi:ring and YY1 binding protein [Temnothorax americanus]|uniref:RING1 and YY1-binding protein n=2 Tax=Temnothorax TaxID=300110 RepID=A0A6J1QLB1_9HYME|nr:PREDICTED: RING1 and YY1-binding protein [Vollenhovia emeryi]XP_011869771.1 PREDICTED: RING1 and YY1-binding protein [Vollenhovia emeryi]XP_011869772.1 PREDICTED: RING1 and YY1-binding protein [Vollenhovia emeryi]XP_011869773.1 PREDICTED: RING1 and YY1-binding protein [Vollenhovia emeryi]XP_024881345.1 RING1 and YY1-binding protein [Temnothorax curvispinosus]TGZ43167.1 YY1-associated factor 2 [Temnothorax longispinosus]
MNHSGSGKRQAKVLEENYWDCSVCTYRNTAEAFKCLMCDVRKGTSTRKPRINPQLVAQQVAQQQYVPLLKPGKKEGSGGSTTSGVKEKERKLDKLRRKNRHPPRLKNIDRSTAQSNEVTVNNVTVTITEYKPKVKKGSDQSSNASSEGGSQHDSNQDSRSLDVGTDA